MDKQVRVFASFEAERKAELALYASMTPAQRMALLLEMVATQWEGTGETGQRLERVVGVASLTQR